MRGLLPLLALCLLPGAAMAGACAADRLEVRTAAGVSAFSVEIADDEAERAKGLMFRHELPQSQGMLFVYGWPQRVAFWMKNTLIPLDMLFIRTDGTVERIKSMAAPGDETPIPGGDDIQFVLEIGGGEAARLNIGEGAEIRHPAVDPVLAKWSCAAP